MRQTRRLLDALGQETQANARGDQATANKAAGIRESQELGDLYLVGDDEVALAWRDLLVHLNDRLGRGLGVDDIVMSVETMARVSRALSEQEDRARAGKPLQELSPTTIAQLRDTRALADRMMGFNVPPTPDGRMNRWAIDFLRWRDRRRRPAAPPRPEGDPRSGSSEGT